MAVDEGKAFAIEQCEGLLRQITDAETVFDTTLAVNEKASNVIRGGLLNVAKLMANVNHLKSTLGKRKLGFARIFSFAGICRTEAFIKIAAWQSRVKKCSRDDR